MSGTGSRTNSRTRVAPSVLITWKLQRFYELRAKNRGQRPIYIFSIISHSHFIFLFKIVLAILTILSFNINFRIILSVSITNLGILMGLALNWYVSLG